VRRARETVRGTVSSAERPVPCAGLGVGTVALGVLQPATGAWRAEARPTGHLLGWVVLSEAEVHPPLDRGWEMNPWPGATEPLTLLDGSRSGVGWVKPTDLASSLAVRMVG
jgi:hypothetical protein